MKRGGWMYALFPVFIGAVVLLVSLTLLIIGARSPDTHSNLNAGFDSGYTRTSQILLGAPVPFEGSGLAAPTTSDKVEHGKHLFVVNDCAACHGLDGRGGIVGPSITGTKAGKLRAKTLAGPKGMPAYAPGTLSDEDLAGIAAYLSTMSQASGPAPKATPETTMGAMPPAAADNPAAATPTGAPAAMAMTTGNSNITGESLYQLSCAACHGQDRAGKKFDQDGQTVTVPELSWDDLSKMYQTNPTRGTVQEQLDLAITKGQNEDGDDFSPMMPRWTSLSKEQVDSLIQYLQAGSTSTEAAPAAAEQGSGASTMGMSSSPMDLQGEQLYQLSCSACHGQDRAGKKIEQDGQSISIPELNWAELSKMYQSNPSRGTVPEQLMLAITKGQNEDGEDFGALMPRWSSLTKEQVDRLIQYLQTASTGAGKEPAMGAAAMDLKGEQLYQTACAACHGEDRAGKKIEQDGLTLSVPALSWDDLNKMYQTNPSRGTVMEQLGLAITKGLDEEGGDFDPLMPRWSFLSKEQVDSLIQYLQTGSK